MVSRPDLSWLKIAHLWYFYAVLIIMDFVKIGHGVEDKGGVVDLALPAAGPPLVRRDDEWYKWYNNGDHGDLDELVAEYEDLMHGEEIPENVPLPPHVSWVARGISGILNCAESIQRILDMTPTYPGQTDDSMIIDAQKKIEAMAEGYTCVIVKLHCPTEEIMESANKALLDGAFFPRNLGLLEGLHINVVGPQHALAQRHVHEEHELTARGKDILLRIPTMVEVVINHHSVYCNLHAAVAEWASRVLVYLLHTVNAQGQSRFTQPFSDSEIKGYKALQGVDSAEWPAILANTSYGAHVPYDCRTSYAMHLMQVAYRQEYVPVCRDFSVRGLPLGVQLIILKLDHARLGLPWGSRVDTLIEFIQACGAFSLANTLFADVQGKKCRGLLITPDVEPVRLGERDTKKLRVL